MADFHRAIASGTPVPPGFEIVDEGSRVTATLTGLILEGTGERQVTVTVHAVSAEIDTATLLLNGQLTFSATRLNGAIVDRAGHALATMSVLIPPNPPFMVEVSWTDTLGFTRSHAFNPLQ